MSSSQEFRDRIARLTRLQKLQDQLEQAELEEEKEKTPKKKEYSPAICGVKKSLENFRHTVKENNEEER